MAKSWIFILFVLLLKIVGVTLTNGATPNSTSDATDTSSYVISTTDKPTSEQNNTTAEGSDITKMTSKETSITETTTADFNMSSAEEYTATSGDLNSPLNGYDNTSELSTITTFASNRSQTEKDTSDMKSGVLSWGEVVSISVVTSMVTMLLMVLVVSLCLGCRKKKSHTLNDNNPNPDDTEANHEKEETQDSARMKMSAQAEVTIIGEAKETTQETGKEANGIAQSIGETKGNTEDQKKAATDVAKGASTKIEEPQVTGNPVKEVKEPSKQEQKQDTQPQEKEGTTGTEDQVTSKTVTKPEQEEGKLDQEKASEETPRKGQDTAIEQKETSKPPEVETQKEPSKDEQAVDPKPQAGQEKTPSAYISDPNYEDALEVEDTNDSETEKSVEKPDQKDTDLDEYDDVDNDDADTKKAEQRGPSSTSSEPKVTQVADKKDAPEKGDAGDAKNSIVEEDEDDPYYQSYDMESNREQQKQSIPEVRTEDKVSDEQRSEATSVRMSYKSEDIYDEVDGMTNDNTATTQQQQQQQTVSQPRVSQQPDTEGIYESDYDYITGGSIEPSGQQTGGTVQQQTTPDDAGIYESDYDTIEVSGKQESKVELVEDDDGDYASFGETETKQPDTKAEAVEQPLSNTTELAKDDTTDNATGKRLSELYAVPNKDKKKAKEDDSTEPQADVYAVPDLTRKKSVKKQQSMEAEAKDLEDSENEDEVQPALPERTVDVSNKPDEADSPGDKTLEEGQSETKATETMVTESVNEDKGCNDGSPAVS